MIADGVNTMRIVLRFRADGHEWVVTRARHRNAAASVDKLTSPTGGGPNVDGARNVTERITELVGLDHDQFTRAVVLPQGRFDLLLRATESQRTEILSSILGLGDIAVTRELVTATRDRWAEHAGRARRAPPALPGRSRRRPRIRRGGRAGGPRSVSRPSRPARDVATAAERRATACRHTARSAGACARGGAAGTARSGRGARRAAGAGRGAARRAAAVGRRRRLLPMPPSATSSRRSTSCSAGSRRGMRWPLARASLAVVAESVDKDAARLSSLKDELAALGAAAPASVLDPALVAADDAARREVAAVSLQVAAAEQAGRESRAAWRALEDARREVVAHRATLDAAGGPATGARRRARHRRGRPQGRGARRRDGG